MAEYIEREKALSFPFANGKYDNANANKHFINGCETYKDWLIDIPFADVAPVRHGRWGHRWVCSNMTGYEYACSCSECGKPTYRISTLEDMPPYCPNCGAYMMDGGET